MELPSKLLEQIARTTMPKIERHKLIVMDESTHEEHLYQPIQTNSKQYRIAVTFLTGYNGIFNVTDKNNHFGFKNQLPVLILVLFPLVKVLTKFRFSIKKTNELLQRKVLLRKKHIRLQSSLIFQL